MGKTRVAQEVVPLPDEIWNVEKAMNYLQCGRTKLHELINAGLPSRRIGKTRVFDPRDLARWWEAQKEA